MKKILFLSVLFFITTGAQALYYNIAPAPGYSEPLSQGDMIEISDTIEPSPGKSVAYCRWILYYDAIELGRVDIPGFPFEIDDYGFVSGSAALDVGEYSAANRVRLNIVTVPDLEQWVSNNYLEVAPTAPMTPSMGVYGIAIVLLSFPVFILRRHI
jgi:hypothetical protein